MSIQLGRFQPGDIVTGRIITLEQTGVLVDFDTDRLVYVPLSELSLNEIQTPEDVLRLNEIREFLVVGNYDGKSEIFFSHCSPDTLKDSDRLLEAAHYDASRQCGYPISKENIILHTKIIGVGAGGVSARLQWFLCSEEHSPTVSFSIRQLEIKKAWERVRQLQAEDATVYSKVLKKHLRGAIVKTIVKIEGLRGSIRTDVDKHEENIVEGEELPLNIIEVREEYNILMLLHHSVWLRLKPPLQVGQVVSGTIRKIKDYGILVDIGYLPALLPTSKILYSSVENPSQIFKVNAHIEAMIVEINIARGFVILQTVENSA